MANKPPTKPRRQASMPSAAPMPPPPPPVETAAEPAAAAEEPTVRQGAAPAAGTDPVRQRLRDMDVIGDPDAQQDPQEPPQYQPQPQQAPAAPEPQGSAGGALEPFLGNSLARNLGTENPRDFPREIPRSQVGDPAAAMDRGFMPRGTRTREDNVLGKKRHPRQEPGQLNPGVRLFLSNTVKVYADEEGIGKGAALDVLLETGARVQAPHVVARQYARRCEALGTMNDWPDGREQLLELVMRQCDEAMVLRVLARLKAEVQAHQ